MVPYYTVKWSVYNVVCIMRHEQQNKTGNLLITMTAWIETRLERRIQCQLYSQTALYRFTKGLTQNVNLRTNLKLKYNINLSIISNRTLDFKPRFYIIGLCLLLFLHGQWFKSYYSRKLLRNFTICVSALVKRYPGGPMLLYDVGQSVHTY